MLTKYVGIMGGSSFCDCIFVITVIITIRAVENTQGSCISWVLVCGSRVSVYSLFVISGGVRYLDLSIFLLHLSLY